MTAEEMARIIYPALLSPASGPVEWTPAKEGAIRDQALRIATAILAAQTQEQGADEEVLRRLQGWCDGHPVTPDTRINGPMGSLWVSDLRALLAAHGRKGNG